jgi:hypothetical protein
MTLISADPAKTADQEIDDPLLASQREERASRRRFFAVGVSLAAATVAGATSAGAQGTQQPPVKKPSAVRGLVKRLLDAPADPSFDPFKKQSVGTTKGWDSTLTRLVRRVTNGVTEADLKLAQKLGFYGYLNYQLDYAKVADTAVDTYVATNYPLLPQAVEQIYNLDQRLVYDQLSDSNVYRGAFSNRQLYERMVEFWSDHFNISFNEVRYLLLVDRREVIRKHALGNFQDMLRASAHSPAMLEYLDNTRNRRTTLNENYAREIMELHTMGADGGYTQTDVRELARCLTGWTLAGRGNFAFDPNGHDFAAKTVLGQTIAAMPTSAGAQGKSDGDTMIEVILKHPSTARYVSKKMLRWFLQYEPTDAQITAVAAAYTRTNGDIKTMLRTVLTPANLTAATPKFRRPYSFVLAALRGGVQTPTLTNKFTTISARYLPLLGQGMFLWDPPDGYPDKADYWAGGVQQRWNFAVNLTGMNGELVFDTARFYPTGATVDTVIDAISRAFFGGEIPTRLGGQLRTYLSATPTLSATRAREAVQLALSSSTFQWI